MLGIDLNFINGLLLIITGFGIGVLSGFFGVGGSFILTPLLNIFGLPMINAVGTGLSFALVTSIFGGVRHYFNNNIILKVGILVGLFALLGVRISQPLVIYLDKINMADFYIRIVFIILLIILGTLPLLKKRKSSFGSNQKTLPPAIIITGDHKVSLWTLFLIGLFVGLLKGFMGVGGGFVVVPLFILILRMKPHQAVGTSLMVVMISSLYAAYLYLMADKVLILTVVILAVGVYPGIRLGVKAIKNISDYTLQRFYSIFLLLSSLGIMLRQFSFSQASLVYMAALLVGVTFTILRKYYFGRQHPFDRKLSAIIYKIMDNNKNK